MCCAGAWTEEDLHCLCWEFMSGGNFVTLCSHHVPHCWPAGGTVARTASQLPSYHLYGQASLTRNYPHTTYMGRLVWHAKCNIALILYFPWPHPRPKDWISHCTDAFVICCPSCLLVQFSKCYFSYIVLDTTSLSMCQNMKNVISPQKPYWISKLQVSNWSMKKRQSNLCTKSPTLNLAICHNIGCS